MTADLATYGHGEIPDGWATMSMLARQHRRRPAPGQPAVGYYRVRKGEVPLYAIAGAVELPAMSDKQRARWEGNRTCARCETMYPDPVTLLDDGRRVDWDCRQAERLARSRVSWLALRMQAVAWAREFAEQADGVIVVGRLVSGRSSSASPVELLAVDQRRDVLVDVLTWPSPYENLTDGGVKWPRSPRSVYDLVEGRTRRLAPGGGAVDADEIVPLLFPLVGRPMVYLTVDGSGDPIGHVGDSSRLWSSHGLSLVTGAGFDRGDRYDSHDFAVRWRDWLAEPQPGQNYWPGREGLRSQRVEAATAAAGVTRVLVGLLRMVLDDHPDGPAVCPVLAETGLEPCGEPVGLEGTCSGHAPAPAESPDGLAYSPAVVVR